MGSATESTEDTEEQSDEDEEETGNEEAEESSEVDTKKAVGKPGFRPPAGSFSSSDISLRVKPGPARTAR